VGSIVHPHIQVLLESRPAPIIEVVTGKCRRWQKEHGEEFWTTLIREETDGG
jgi:galactose-1-phosphate uridylyltransferase